MGRLLLTPRSVNDYAPREFLEYVKSLYSLPASSKPRIDIVGAISKRGKLIVRTKRKPKWATDAEVSEIAKHTEVGEEEVRSYLKKRGFIISAKPMEVFVCEAVMKEGANENEVCGE